MPHGPFLHAPTRIRARTLLIIVLVVAGLSSMIGLETAPLLDWDENMQSEVARQVMLSGDILQLQLNSQPFTEKPPLFFLEMAGFFKLLGVSEMTARLTSAVNGLLFVAALFGIACVLVDAPFAALWGLLYASSLLPLILSRAAVIEHTFNALMALGALCLVAYDEAYAASANRPAAANARLGPRTSREPHPWAWLGAAALALGLAVLAKGPSGGAVPLVAFAGYKLARRGVGLNPLHWLACGVVALAVALSWYAANYALHGGAFVQEFARFMGLLFSRPLEGHAGPFYYHFAVGIVGLFPWTPLLLLYAVRDVRAAVLADPVRRALVVMGVVWAGFILIVFSIVRTKLPHYSSGMYVPLTLLAALALYGAVQVRGRVPAWLCAVMAAYAVALGVGLAIVPYRMAGYADAAGVGFVPPLGVPELAWLPGAILAVGVVAGAALLAFGRALAGVAITAATVGLTVIGLWRVHLPMIAAYNQGPMIEMMDEVYAADGDLALYRTVSYAALFYGDRDILMVGTYKFSGDASRLDTPGERPLFVVTARENEADLQREHPKLALVERLGTLVMYRLPAQGETQKH
jgi:4-amino-4-deoxy-L-arabinose transferase-like glycosyltransferase